MKKVVLFLFILGFWSNVKGQNYKFQALYLYNIVQRVEWPQLSNIFTIGVIGCEELSQELNLIAQSRKLLGHPIEVREYSSLINEVPKCQLLYIGRNSSPKLHAILSIIRNEPILVVSNKSGLEGAGINFIDNTSKIEFEIFPTTIESHNLKVSSSLFNLGIVKR